MIYMCKGIGCLKMVKQTCSGCGKSFCQSCFAIHKCERVTT